MYMSYDNKPIGWWLKHVDRLIEDGFDSLLATDGLARRHWQLLNAIGDGAEPEVALAPFLAADPGARAAELAGPMGELRGRGWVGVDGLTPAGAAARSRIGTAVGEFRARVATGVEPEEHRLVIATLRRMAANLTCPG